MALNNKELSKESILMTIKGLLGYSGIANVFDSDIITAINTAMFRLGQLGVNNGDPFAIQDESSTWGEYLREDYNLESVKSYILIKTRLLFDPPTNSYLVNSLQNQLNDLEYCIRDEISYRRKKNGKG